MNYGRRMPAVLMLAVLTAGIAIAEGTMTGTGKDGDRSNANAARAIAHERENWIRPHVLRPAEEKAGSPSRINAGPHPRLPPRLLLATRIRGAATVLRPRRISEPG
jgi:hypothetical protein